MTLERRLTYAVVGLVATLLLAGGVVLLSQRQYLLNQLDAQVAGIAARPQAALALAQRGGLGRRMLTAYGEVWVGTEDANGRVSTVIAPESDPDLLPRLVPGQELPTPVGRASAAGLAPRVRVVTARLRDGTLLVVAAPTTRVEAAARRLTVELGLAALAVLLVMGAVLVWVRRLGLAPIRSMTAAADAVTSGDRSRRIPPAPAGSEAAHLGDALNAMLDATRESEDRMRQFVADASHELRTPLTTLKGYADLHAGFGGDPAVADALRRIRSEAGRMHRLVEDLLTLTSLDGSRLERAAVRVGPVLEDVAADLRVASPGRSVVVSCPPGLVGSVDLDRFTQAVMALGSNALRHTPPEAEVRLTAYGRDDGFTVEVSDDGPGIPEAELGRVWDRFAQVSPGRVGGGTGLGLAVVAAIVAAHGGRYAVSSPPGQGARFVLTFPG